MERNKKILIFLVVMFLISLAYRLMNPFKQKTVSELTYTSGQPYTGAKGSKKNGFFQASSKKDLMIDLFLNPQRHNVKVFRNIFEKKSPMVASTGAPSEDITIAQEQAEMMQVLQSDDELTTMNKALGRLTVFGTYEHGDQKYLFFERDKDVLIVQNGDKIDGKYLVEKISDKSFTVRSDKLDVSVTMDISGLDE